MTWWGWLLVGLGAVALLVGAIGLLLRGHIARLRQDPLLRRTGALPLRAKLSLVRRLFRDRRVPWWAKALLPALALYLVMPIDLIPDFIPVVGYLDDLVVVLLVASILFRAVPRDVIDENVKALESEGRAVTATTGEGRGH
jgi:uncharacterized membrane protein YkvA (DUF1232 family)